MSIHPSHSRQKQSAPAPRNNPPAEATSQPPIPQPAVPQQSLSLVSPQRPPARVPHTPLALWHLLSLDAPSVAAVWTWVVASATGLRLPWTAPAAMFFAVWMLYASDRLLDARPLPGGQSPPELEERHRFHQRHRRAFLIGITLSACLLAALLRFADPAAMRLYALLAALLCAWFLLIHARPLPGDGTHRLPKELAVGIFFPAAVFIPTVARLPQLRLDLLPVALLLAATCSLNCLFLYAWEHPGDRPHAHWSTRWATRHLIPLTSSVALLSLAWLITAQFLIGRTHLRYGTLLLTACIFASTLLLLLLHFLRHRLQPVHSRALADLTLITPLIIMPLTRLAQH
jgi:hypothetical protein